MFILIGALLCFATTPKLFKVLVRSPLLFQIVTSEARKYTIEIPAKELLIWKYVLIK